MKKKKMKTFCLSFSLQAIQRKCVEFRTEIKRLYHGRFVVSPFEKGQANTVGIAMRRAPPDETYYCSLTYNEAPLKNRYGQ